MKKTNMKTTTFETGIENFMIDIVENPEIVKGKIISEYFEVWLYDYFTGIKAFVCGESKSSYPGCTVEMYAEYILQYLYTKNNDGLNWFEQYKKDYN